MQRIVNFFFGSVRVEVRGSYPERFLNLCARNGIKFRNMETCDVGVFRIDMSPRSFLVIRDIARRSMCRVHIVSKNGLPFLARRVKKRTLLVAGFALFCIAAWIFTGFVWAVDIDGFPSLDEERLAYLLKREGLRTGASVNSIDIEELRNNILIDMPELAYIYVNFSGARARVIARQRKAPPDILPADVPCDIISDKDGIVESITVKTGTPEVAKGDTVVRGEILASGYVTGRAGTTVMTHADAEITLKTWSRKSARMPKKQQEKNYTGREKKCYTIILSGNRIKLYPNSRISYTKCDKIIDRKTLMVSEKISLPISLECATYREYEIIESTLQDEKAYEVMGDTLSGKIAEKEDCEVLSTRLSTSSDGNFAYATITAECIEKAGVERKILKD
ncbi:MAG: sporulation protein YqfD [Oscillospiraceae bacterium]|nr:sporulation protein YqfD [Oscillospiraceae bacterium]